MNLPKNTSLPFFAYGLFKPGQLCYPRIKNFVDKTIEGTVKGILKERDGIPLLVKSNDSETEVKGSLIHFQNKKEVEAYQRIIDIEPGKVYCWKEIRVNSKLIANALFGKNPSKGASYLEDVLEWDGKSDPLFNQGLKEVETILKKNDS
jgi:hypothetical protein